MKRKGQPGWGKRWIQLIDRGPLLTVLKQNPLTSVTHKIICLDSPDPVSHTTRDTSLMAVAMILLCFFSADFNCQLHLRTKAWSYGMTSCPFSSNPRVITRENWDMTSPVAALCAQVWDCYQQRLGLADMQFDIYSSVPPTTSSMEDITFHVGHSHEEGFATLPCIWTGTTHVPSTRHTW